VNAKGVCSTLWIAVALAALESQAQQFGPGGTIPAEVIAPPAGAQFNAGPDLAPPALSPIAPGAVAPEAPALPAHEFLPAAASWPPCSPPPTPCWTPTWQLFGEAMFLRARDAEVPFAVPINGPIVPPPNNPIQVGPVALADPNYEPGFRVGLSRALDECTSLRATYSFLETNAVDASATTAPNVLRSLVAHPSSQSAATDFLFATASNDIDFQLADVDYRGLIACNDRFALHYVLGSRYFHLRQDFWSQFTDLGTETVATQVYFDGGGLRVGLEGERHAANYGLMVYGRSAASFVAGEFRGRYNQQDSFDPLVVNTTWKAGRLVPMLDLELGFGWTSPCKHWRLTSGYMVNAWFNTVRTKDFIRAVQNNSFDGMGNALVFDGVVGRIEYRY
jgi:hypothetical protein